MYSFSKWVKSNLVKKDKVVLPKIKKIMTKAKGRQNNSGAQIIAMVYST
jgi:hypothetical protein